MNFFQQQNTFNNQSRQQPNFFTAQNPSRMTFGQPNQGFKGFNNGMGQNQPMQQMPQNIFYQTNKQYFTGNNLHRVPEEFEIHQRKKKILRADALEDQKYDFLFEQLRNQQEVNHMNIIFQKKISELGPQYEQSIVNLRKHSSLQDKKISQLIDQSQKIKEKIDIFSSQKIVEILNKILESNNEMVRFAKHREEVSWEFGELEGMVKNQNDLLSRIKSEYQIKLDFPSQDLLLIKKMLNSKLFKLKELMISLHSVCSVREEVEEDNFLDMEILKDIAKLIQRTKEEANMIAIMFNDQELKRQDLPEIALQSQVKKEAEDLIRRASKKPLF